MMIAALLAVSTLFGGMIFFSFGFAPVLFKQLPTEKVRPLLRGTFPYYYLVIIVLAAICTGLAAAQSVLAAALLGIITLSTIYARQFLMIQVNAASDREDKAAFGRLHGVSVVIQLVQIGLAGWSLVLIA